MRHRNQSWGPLIALFMLLATMLPALATPVAEAGGVVVETADGPVRGEAVDGYHAFRGIPFAAPPVGELRWQAPQPVTPWTSVRLAADFGSPCVQPRDFLIGDQTGSEDCLYLNITAPETATTVNPKPVMVWLHGGAFIAGAGSLFDPHRMVLDGDVVVVTLNYRLAVFGFLSFPWLTGSGTFGLQDQQAALRWVQRNIAAFGGDPDNVTLFGESAGGLSTCAQLTAPAARGLFHKAIIQSGPCNMSWPNNGLLSDLPAGSAFVPLTESELLGTVLGAAYRCLGKTTGIACLRNLTADVLRQNRLGYLFASPAYDTPTLPQAPVAALAANDFMAVPVIAGTTQRESTAFFADYFTRSPLTAERYRLLLFAAFGDSAHAVAALYAGPAKDSPADAWATIMTDRVFACPNLLNTELLAAHVPVYAYEFADPNPPQLDPAAGIPAGAYHASDVQYLLDRTGTPSLLDPAQLQLSTAMIDYWTTFAHTGNPNGAGRPDWAPFDPTATDPVVLSLKPGPSGIAPVAYATEHNCDFWATHGVTD